ncbi:hypothetical protein SESBI_30698 [Sesbania bispinosa]|nr:hypothetical protein SESBI_30698 [Sesbania bispinosa]
MFIDTIQFPFYNWKIGSVSSNFSDIVIIGEKVEGGMRNGKITLNASGVSSLRKPLFGVGGRKEGEAHAIMSERGKSSHNKPNYTPIHYPQAFHTHYMSYLMFSQRHSLHTLNHISHS